MADFIFLNPSTNLLKLADNVKGRGFQVKLVKNEQFPDITADNVHIFHDEGFDTYFQGKQPIGSTRQFSKLKKGLFSGFSQRSVRGELVRYSRDYCLGDIVDLAVMKRKSLETNRVTLSPVSSASSFSEIAEDNSNAVIVTGYMEFVAGNEKLSMYDTDFDLKEAIGNDYFVFMNQKMRLEMCCSGNRLVTIGHKKDDHLGFLYTKMPFLKKFEFKRVKELIISRNRMPWVINSLDKGLIILNDFSYFNVSVKMSTDWFDKVGKYICSGRHQ